MIMRNMCFSTVKKSNDCRFGWLVGFMIFSATFNNISVISWRSVLLVEETGGARENHRPIIVGGI